MRWLRGTTTKLGNDHEVGHVDAMIMQNLFRDALVLAQDKTSRAAASKGQALHFEK